MWKYLELGYFVPGKDKHIHKTSDFGICVWTFTASQLRVYCD